MEGEALAAMLPPWSYKSELLTPKPEPYHHLPSEGHHPRQGDKQGINRFALHVEVLPVVGYHPEDRCLSLFIALRLTQEPERVMVGLAENIQACLRIFRRAQHQWLARDILHQAQGVFIVFVLWPR